MKQTNKLIDLEFPEDYAVLLAPSRKAFVPESQHTVSHGGISIEEIIVPFVRIERKRA